MLKLLIWTYRCLAKAARTFDIWGCDKVVVDEETSAKSISIGQTFLFVIAIAVIGSIFYLVHVGADLMAVFLILLFFGGFYFLWYKGEKITVTFDKTLKAEPERRLIATWVLPGYCDLCFAVDGAGELTSGKYDDDIDLNVDYVGSVGSVGSIICPPLYEMKGMTIDVSEVLGQITVTGTIPEFISEACLIMMQESIENYKQGRVSDPIDFDSLPEVGGEEEED